MVYHLDFKEGEAPRDLPLDEYLSLSSTCSGAGRISCCWAGGISLTQVFLMRKGRTRRPWTRDRWLPLDVLCAYLTFQFFSLIHVFARPRQDLTTRDMTRLFLKEIGLDLGGPD